MKQASLISSWFVAVAVVVVTASGCERATPPMARGSDLLAAERALDPAGASESALDPEPTGAGDDCPATPEGPGDREALRAQLARIVEQAGIPGAAVAVVDGSGTWVAGFGQASLPSGPPMDGDTLFRVGSLTKPFLTLAILRLVESGRLRLSDRVRDLAPEIAMDNAWERTDPVRIAHLLEHTSGFDEMRFNEIFDRDGRQDRPLREVLAVNPHSRVVRWRPGSRFSYSQPGYTLAGYIVEKVTGQPFEQFLEQEVFRPLGVQGAALRLSPAVQLRLATGYHERQPVDPIVLLHRPAGNLMISAAGLARLIELQLHRGLIGGGRFLQAESIERMERCETRSHGVAPVCYGLANWGDVSTHIPMRSHGGFMPGYLSFYAYAPTRGFGFAVLVNDTAGPHSFHLGAAIWKHLTAWERPTPRPAPVPVRDPDRYVGHYRLASPTVEFLRYRSDVYDGITVGQRNGQLIVRGLDPLPMPIFATAEDRFRVPPAYDYVIRFDRSPEGKRLMIVFNDTYEQDSAFWSTARRWALELAVLLLSSAAWLPFLLLLAWGQEWTRPLRPPLLAAACLLGMTTAFEQAQLAGQLGEATPSTVLVCLCSWLFAFAAHIGLRRALHALRDTQTPPWLRAYSLLLSAAAVWIALHLSHYNLIGLRTWRW